MSLHCLLPCFACCLAAFFAGTAELLCSQSRQGRRGCLNNGVQSGQHRLLRRESAPFRMVFFETLASWQYWIDCNTISARLSRPGCNTCSPGVWRTDSTLSKRGRALQKLSHFSTSLPTPSGSPQNRQQASPGTRDPLQDDSSELSAQAPRLQENVPLACPNCLAPQHPTTRRILQVLTWSLVWNCCALPASKKSTPVTVASFKSQSALAFLCCPDVLPCTA